MSCGARAESCFKILDEVKRSHKEVIITKRGKPIAKLMHINQTDEKDPLLGALERMGGTNGDLTKPMAAFSDWELD